MERVISCTIGRDTSFYIIRKPLALINCIGISLKILCFYNKYHCT